MGAGKGFIDMVTRGATIMAEKSGAISANTALGGRIGTKGVRDHIADGVGVALNQSDNRVLSYMQGGGILGAGGEKGVQGMKNAAASVTQWRGEGRAMRASKKEFSDAIASGTLTDAEKTEAQANIRNIDRTRRGVSRNAGMAWSTAKGGFGYLNSGNFGQRAAKFGVAGAAWVGGNGLLRRGTSGGSMGYNQNGERDIAGIPFI